MLLEVFNTLALAFIATENPQWHKIHEQHPKLISAVVLANVFLSDNSSAFLAWLTPDSPLTAAQTAGRAIVASLFMPIEWMGVTIGTSGVVALMAMVLSLSVLHAQKAAYGSRVLVLLLGLAVFIALWLAEADDHVHHQEPLKVLTLLLVFGAACLADVRRSIPEISTQQFLHNVQGAVLLVLPVCPCISVLLSCGFLVVVSFFEKLRIDPHFLNSTIYYGTMYGCDLNRVQMMSLNAGPFGVVYYETKKACFRQGYLLPS